MRVFVPLLHNVTNIAVIVFALWIMFFASELDFSFLRLLLSFVAGIFLIKALPFGQALIPILWERWWLATSFTEVTGFAWALGLAAAIAEAMLFIYIGIHRQEGRQEAV